MTEKDESIAPAEGMPAPAEGMPAPEFNLPSSSGTIIGLDQFRGQRNVVLYFYPMDDTPGCTKEACFFRDMTPDFEALDTVILGVSADSVASHQDFARKFTLPFPLLADEDGEVARRYGSWREASPDTNIRAMPRRNTFIIDKEGIVRRVFPKVKVEEHAPEVLSFIKATLQA